VVGKFTGGVGTVNVDSGGTLESTDTIVIGDEGKGTLTIQNGLVQTGGTIVVNNGNTANVDTINAVDGTIETSGGITILGLGQVSLNHSTLTATAGDALLVENGGDATISISNVNNTITASSGNLLRGIGGAKATLTVDASTLTGNILADSASTVDVNLLNNSTLTAVIQGAHNLMIDPSTWIMPDTSFITGDLTLLGNLIINSAAKFAATGEASVLTIGGNLKMGSGSTTSLGIGGLNGEQYDHIQVGGNATVNGSLVVSSLGGFHPSAGNAFLVLRTNGTRSGNFTSLDDSAFRNNPNITPSLRPVDVEIVAPNGIILAYVKPTGPTPPIIDVIPEPLPPVNPEEPLSLSFVLKALNPTAEQLTSMFEIPFSGANTQRFNLNDRMAQIQRGSTGFVSAVAPAPPPPPTGKEVGKKEVVPPAFVPGPTNRWGVWVNGWGDWVNVNGDNGIKGYDFTTGGVSVGVDYRITDYLAVGAFGTYAHTWTSLNPGAVDVNTGRGGLYATYWNCGFFVNGGIYGGSNSYDTSRGTLLQGRSANGSTSGYEFSTFIDVGYQWQRGDFSVGPVFAAQYTNVHIDSFTEQGSFLPLNIHSDSEESWRTDLGVQASYAWHVGQVIVIPSLWAAWEHEYKYSNLPITFSSAEFPGVSATVFGPHEGHDSAIINAGVGTQWTPRIATYVGYQGQLGRDNYDANGVTGTISFSF